MLIITKMLNGGKNVFTKFICFLILSHNIINKFITLIIRPGSSFSSIADDINKPSWLEVVQKSQEYKITLDLEK